MTEEKILQILKDTDYVRTSGTAEEKKCAEYLAQQCRELGVEAHLEEFPVSMATIRKARLLADGKEIPCTGVFLSGSGELEAPLYYLPNHDKASISQAKGKIVLIDSGMTRFLFRDLYEAGAVGYIIHDGNVNYADRDIAQKELREIASEGRKMPAVNINAASAMQMMKDHVKTVRIELEQEEYMGVSQNVVAEIPGASDEYITLTAHYDSTSLSHGAYDNMSGCIGLLGIMDCLTETPIHYSLRFIFCGSEERGLLGSKAYTAAHEKELDKCVLNINLDMIGSVVGKFIACCTCEMKLVDYLTYRAAILGIGLEAKQGVYASDSTPFADHGVPAVSFARLGGDAMTPIHVRYDTMDVLDTERLMDDIDILACFAEEMAYATVCPVSREIPENVKKELDEYLFRKRKED